MTAEHDVISAFVDDEPFDPQELAEALASPEERDVLIDILVLRRLTAVDDVLTTGRAVVPSRWSPPRLLAAAAVLALAIAGGYQLGVRTPAPPEEPPAPTLVVTGDDVWREIGDGGRP